MTKKLKADNKKLQNYVDVDEDICHYTDDENGNPTFPITFTSPYVSIDTDKIQSLDDVKNLLKALNLSVSKELAKKYNITHLLK